MIRKKNKELVSSSYLGVIESKVTKMTCICCRYCDNGHFGFSGFCLGFPKIDSS